MYAQTVQYSTFDVQLESPHSSSSGFTFWLRCLAI